MAKKKVAKKKTVTKKKEVVKKTAVKSQYSGFSIDQLLKALATATDPIEKRKIRGHLRAQGHTGGLNKKSVKKISKKKTSKKKI